MNGQSSLRCDDLSRSDVSMMASTLSGGAVCACTYQVYGLDEAFDAKKVRMQSKEPSKQIFEDIAFLSNRVSKGENLSCFVVAEMLENMSKHVPCLGGVGFGLLHSVLASWHILKSEVLENVVNGEVLITFQNKALGSLQSDKDLTMNQRMTKEAVYGLTELLREEIHDACLVANPGCYPTSVQLPLIPLLKARLIQTYNIIIDAKSGVSGAGRGAKEANLYTEIAEGIHSYGITRHRH
ncbi:hypothetical protein KI387_036824, partial [Taxus chinensis]